MSGYIFGKYCLRLVSFTDDFLNYYSRNWIGSGSCSKGLPLHHRDARENEHGEGQSCLQFQILKDLHLVAHLLTDPLQAANVILLYMR